MDEGLQELEKEGYPFIKRRRLVQPSREVLLSIRDRSKVEVQELFYDIHEVYNDSILYIENLHMIADIMDFIADSVLKINTRSFSIEYIKCSVLLYVISNGEVYCDRYFNI